MEVSQDPSQTSVPSSEVPGLTYTLSNPSMLPQASLTTSSTIPVPQTISADEIALYDRQIRLWGVQAQEKLRSAKILLVTVRALANEIAKNLVLAGVGSLTMIDHEAITGEDLASQFLISEEHVGQNRAQAASTQLQKLNNRVQISIDTSNVRDKPPEFFSAFDITIATDLDFDTASTINNCCRISRRRFYAAGTHGLFGYAFADLISHTFIIERDVSNVPTAPNTAESATRTFLSSTAKTENGRVTELVTKNEIYSPIILANTSPLPEEYTRIRRRRMQVTPLLTCFRALWEFQKIQNGALPNSFNKADLELFTTLTTEKHKELQLPHETLRSDFLRSFLQNLGSQISPTAAFVGGALAQDVINVLGAREQPLQNLLLFDGEECKAPIYPMHPIFPAMGTAGNNELAGNGLGTASMVDDISMNGSGVGAGVVGNDMQETNGNGMTATAGGGGGSVIV